VELALYATVVFAAITFSFRTSPTSSQTTFEITILAGFFIFSMAIRLIDFDADIRTYARRMEEAELTFYYIREPVVWIGHRVLFALTHSHVMTFVISDMLCLSLVIRAFRRLDMPQYAIIAFIAFFPFVLGMQNVYRQWVSSCLAIYALSVADRNLGRALFAFLLAMLSHNAAALFFPVVFSRLSPTLRAASLLLGTILIPIALVLGADTKSATTTGLNLEHAYLVLVCLTLVGTLSPRTLTWKPWSLVACVFSIYVVAWSTVTLSSAGSERIALFALMILYPSIVLFIEDNIVDKFMARAALTVFGFLPMLIFGVRVFII